VGKGALPSWPAGKIACAPAHAELLALKTVGLVR